MSSVEKGTAEWTVKTILASNLEMERRIEVNIFSTRKEFVDLVSSYRQEVIKHGDSICELSKQIALQNQAFVSLLDRLACLEGNQKELDKKYADVKQMADEVCVSRNKRMGFVAGLMLVMTAAGTVIGTIIGWAMKIKGVGGS